MDANIAFRALASSRGDLRHRLDPSDDFRFIAPRFLFVELFKHKDRLLRAMGKSEDELLEALHALVASLDFTDEAAIPIGAALSSQRSFAALRMTGFVCAAREDASGTPSKSACWR